MALPAWKSMYEAVTCYASAARTTDPTPMADKVNQKHRGIRVTISVTAVVSTPSVVFTVQGKDTVTGAYYTLLASAAVTGTGTTVLTVFPGATAATNVAANNYLPGTWRVIATHGDSDSATYVVGAELIP